MIEPPKPPQSPQQKHTLPVPRANFDRRRGPRDKTNTLEYECNIELLEAEIALEQPAAIANVGYAALKRSFRR